MSSPSIESTLNDAQAQIRDLRRQLDGLMSDRVQPAMNNAADQASKAMNRASQIAREEADVAIDYVRERPITTVLAAAALGYVIARLTR